MSYLKRLVGVFLFSSALILAACQGGHSSASDQSRADGKYAIGAVTFVSHPALDAVSKGFQDGLNEAGIKVDYDFQNPQGDSATLSSIVNTFAANKKDLYFAIATAPAQALYQVVQDAPILFAGVTDPVSAGIVDSWQQPGANVTGISDLSPVRKHLELIKQISPKITSIGIVYSSSEANSQVLVDLAKAAARELGLQLKTATVTNTSEVAQAAESLNVDAYYVPTDNTVVTAVESMVQAAEKHHRLLVAADADSVSRGAAAALAVDYYQQGKQAAAIAIKILKQGIKPAKIPVQTQKNLNLVVNPKAAQAQGFTLPPELIKQAKQTI